MKWYNRLKFVSKDFDSAAFVSAKIMIARAPRRPSAPVPVVPNYERVILQFGKLRKRWKRREPIPCSTEAFAAILKEQGVFIFAIDKGHIECQAAQARIVKALGS